MLVPLLALLIVQNDLRAQEDWRAKMEAGRQAFAHRAYTDAATQLTAALEAASAESGNEPAAIETARLLAAVHREMGNLPEAEKVLQSAAALCLKINPAASEVRLAVVMEELTAVLRAEGKPKPAQSNLEIAIRIREMNGDAQRVELARDLTTFGLMRYQTAGVETATKDLTRAVAEWDAALPGDPQALAAIEALAGCYREQNMYAEAEPFYRRALRLREAWNGPESAEVIADVDSLAYVNMGLQKFEESEAFYKRLLALWVKNAGAEHPMVALTLEKMAESYAQQKRYDDAQKCAADAVVIRGKAHFDTLRQNGRMMVLQSKLPEAEEFFRRALQIGELTKLPDDVLDPLLTQYVEVLRGLKRTEEATAMQARIDAARDRKADREGRKAPPANAVPIPVKKP